MIFRPCLWRGNIKGKEKGRGKSRRKKEQRKEKRREGKEGKVNTTKIFYTIYIVKTLVSSAYF
jgi:hypothetical protein